MDNNNDVVNSVSDVVNSDSDVVNSDSDVVNSVSVSVSDVVNSVSDVVNSVSDVVNSVSDVVDSSNNVLLDILIDNLVYRMMTYNEEEELTNNYPYSLLLSNLNYISLLTDYEHSYLNDYVHGYSYNHGYNDNEILHSSLYERNPIKHVISNEIKEKLIKNIIKFRDAVNVEGQKLCAITYEEFVEDSDIIQLPCFHCFFAQPIITWLTEECSSCPVCKYNFDSVEKNSAANAGPLEDDNEMLG